MGSVADLQRDGTQGIIIGEELAKRLGIGIGSRVNLLSPSGQSSTAGFTPRIRPFEVVGMERNLFGRGYWIQLQGFFSWRRTSGVLSFTNPRLYDTNLSVGNDIYYTHDYWDSFTKDTVGDTVRLSYPIGEYTSVGTAYRLERYVLYDVDDDASPYISDYKGINWTSAISGRILRDTTDSKERPTKGTIARLWAEYGGGGLGGTDNFIKTVADWQGFWSINPQNTIHIRGRVGGVFQNTDDKVPVFERFWVGGMLNARTDESRRLAGDIQRLSLFRLKKRQFETRDNGTKSAPFIVLLGAQMPAVLVELGYCTNSEEARNLLLPKYRMAGRSLTRKAALSSMPGTSAAVAALAREVNRKKCAWGSRSRSALISAESSSRSPMAPRQIKPTRCGSAPDQSGLPTRNREVHAAKGMPAKRSNQRLKLLPRSAISMLHIR